MADQLENTAIPGPVSASSFERNLLGVAKGGGITLAGKMFTNISRFVTAFLLARLLGAQQYGMYQIALNAGTLFSGLALLGMDTALVRYVAISSARRDDESTWGTLQVGIGIPAMVSVVTGLALFALAYPVAESIFHNAALAPLLQVMGLIIPTLTMSDLLVGAVRGFKNMEYPVIAQFVAQPMARLVLIGIAAFGGLTVMQAVIIFGIGDLVATGVLIYYLNRLFPLRRPFSVARRNPRELLTFAFPEWLASTLDRFGVTIQTFFLGSLSSIAGAGIFAIANQINTVGHDFYTSLNISARPLIAELHDQGERPQLERVYQTATKWSLTVNLPLFLIIILFPEQILAIFGTSFVAGASTLAVLALANLVDVGTGMCGSILNMTGYTKLKFANNSISLAVSIILDLALIPRWGIMGAALSNLVIILLLNIARIIEVYFLIGLRPYNRSFFKPVAAGLVAYLCTLFLVEMLSSPPGLLAVILLSVLLTAIFVGAILLMGLSPEDHLVLRSMRQRVRALIGR
jgi:O-antigen/teichoic acid export membrane protein